MQIKTTEIPSYPRVATTEKRTNASKEAEKRESLYTANENII